jgi:xylulokinase
MCYVISRTRKLSRPSGRKKLMNEVTVGIDIGTTSVKAVAAGAGGKVLARVRISHRVVSTDPGQFEHDPQDAWIDGVLSAWDRMLAGTTDRSIAAVTVSAMVPSMCGTTLLPWVLTGEWVEIDGLWTFPSARAGLMAVGGASNAGGLFIDRVQALVGDPAPADLLALDGGDLPVWLPYPRGERTPLHDPDRRAELLDMHVGHTPAHVLIAAYEAAGFVVRHHIDLSGLRVDRIVAMGDGTQSAAWMQALADTTGLAVDVSAEPYGAAHGAAYHSRVTAGLEADTFQARRWGRVSHRVEPRPAHAAAAEGRYRRFREGTDR